MLLLFSKQRIGINDRESHNKKKITSSRRLVQLGRSAKKAHEKNRRETRRGKAPGISPFFAPQYFRPTTQLNERVHGRGHN